MNNLVGNSPLSDSEFSVFLLSTLSFPQHNFFSVIKINPSCNFFSTQIDWWVFIIFWGIRLVVFARTKNSGELRKSEREKWIIDLSDVGFVELIIMEQNTLMMRFRVPLQIWTVVAQLLACGRQRQSQVMTVYCFNEAVKVRKEF